jgi:hypothetical protein
MTYRLIETPYPHTCDICGVPSSKKRHARCVDLVARRWKWALSKEQRALGRRVGRSVVRALWVTP